MGGRQTVSEAMRVEKRVKIYGLSRCKFERMDICVGIKVKGKEWTWSLDVHKRMIEIERLWHMAWRECNKVGCNLS